MQIPHNNVIDRNKNKKKVVIPVKRVLFEFSIFLSKNFYLCQCVSPNLIYHQLFQENGVM